MGGEGEKRNSKLVVERSEVQSQVRMTERIKKDLLWREKEKENRFQVKLIKQHSKAKQSVNKNYDSQKIKIIYSTKIKILPFFCSMLEYVIRKVLNKKNLKSQLRYGHF